MLIQAKDLNKSYGRVEAVSDVNFTIEPGEFVGLVGPNGAGKSTTIKMLAGQLFPSSGVALIDGKDTKQDPNGARAKIGYVPEHPDLYEYLTGREMLQFVQDIRGGDLDWALSLTGLESDADRQIREYSQGMRRKTAIACALIARPPVIILDESLNGLDPRSVDRVMGALNALRLEGAAILLSTHVLDTLEKIASRVLMIQGGRLVADTGIDALSELKQRF